MRTDNNSVSNLKRRISALPPLSEKLFDESLVAQNTEHHMIKELSSSKHPDKSFATRKSYFRSHNFIQRSDEVNSRASPAPAEQLPLEVQEEDQDCDEEDEAFQPHQCLFCNLVSDSLDSNLSHMSLAHSFFIPDANYLVDVESFLSYLFAVISTFRECLFCGCLKSTKLGVQDHMRGKGHCRIDFENGEHRFKEFYDFSQDLDEEDTEMENSPRPDLDNEKEKNKMEDRPRVILESEEVLLPDGRTLRHRSRPRFSRRRISRQAALTDSTQLQLQSDAEPSARTPEPKGRSVVLRSGTSTSMVGVTELQRRALIAVEAKILQTETRKRNEYQSQVEKGGNKQKTFRAAGIGKKQGGLEKRLG
jgi:pre-60S factor REI1